MRTPHILHLLIMHLTLLLLLRLSHLNECNLSPNPSDFTSTAYSHCKIRKTVMKSLILCHFFYDIQISQTFSQLPLNRRMSYSINGLSLGVSHLHTLSLTLSSPPKSCIAPSQSSHLIHFKQAVSILINSRDSPSSNDTSISLWNILAFRSPVATTLSHGTKLSLGSFISCRICLLSFSLLSRPRVYTFIINCPITSIYLQSHPYYWGHFFIPSHVSTSSQAAIS